MSKTSFFAVLSGLILFSTFALANRQPIIQDPVDNDGSWALVAGGWSIGSHGLLPVEGESYFFALPGRNQGRGIWKLFDETFELNKTYTAEFMVGMQDRFDTRPALARIDVHFFINDGSDPDNWITTNREQSGRDPQLGQWEKWTLTTRITRHTRTAGGQRVTENDKIGFLFRFVGTATHDDGDSQAAFDSLRIFVD